MGTIIPFVPLAKAFKRYLPKIADRKYGEIEAAFSLMIDYDNQNEVTISGYAKLWKWNKKTVSKFIKDHGAMIIYPKDTENYKNQRGLITILKRDQKGTNKGLIAFIDNKDLTTNRDLKRTKEGLKKDQSLPPTIEPDPKPDPKEITYSKTFLKLCTDYPGKIGSKSQTFKNFKTTKNKFSWTDDQVYQAAMNMSKKQDADNQKGDVYYYQLSNVLGLKYRDDLPDLLEFVLTQPTKSTQKQRIVEPDEDEIKYPNGYENAPDIDENFHF